MDTWMEIFKAGDHTTSNGVARSFNEADLHKIAGSYKPDQHEAPIVIGHPKENAPAYGWIEQLKVDGGRLMAKPKQVAPEFAELVRAGRYKKRSMSIYPDGTLRHVGFLGAQPPAVKGLKDFAFSDEEEADTFVIEFQEAEDSMNELEQLQEKLAKETAARVAAEAKRDEFKEQAASSNTNFAELQAQTRKNSITSFIDQGIKDAKILPVWKDKGLAEFMGKLDEAETFEFAEGDGKKSQFEWFKDFISSFSEHELFKKIAAPEGDGKATDDFAEDDEIGKEIAAYAGS